MATALNMHDLIDIVSEMRRAQREYARTGTSSARSEKDQAEQIVDLAIQSLEAKRPALEEYPEPAVCDHSSTLHTADDGYEYCLKCRKLATELSNGC